MTDPSLLERIDRVESTLAIQQLPIRYAIAIDSRDIDGWLGLFVDDVDCGRRGRGRLATQVPIVGGGQQVSKHHQQRLRLHIRRRHPQIDRLLIDYPERARRTN